MISKNEIKFINSLRLQKFRNEHNTFKVEGWRAIKEFLSSDYKLLDIFATNDFLENKNNISKSISFKKINEKDLDKISSFKNSNHTLALFEIKKNDYDLNIFKNKLIIALEDVSNPGNLGSIIRTADWFGIDHIICSSHSVDVYNPKVIQSSMGSLSRVSVQYVNFSHFIKELKKNNFLMFASTLKGESIYKQKITKGVLFFGQESSGLSEATLAEINTRIKIPSRNKLCDSLNLSISSGIIISEIMRTIEK